MQGMLRNENDAVVCANCTVARDPLTRMRGLLGRRGLAQGEGILLQPAGSIHTFFMRFAIDVVFVSRDGRVLKTFSTLVPWRMAFSFGAFAVIELPAGALSQSEPRRGDVMHVTSTPT